MFHQQASLGNIMLGYELKYFFCYPDFINFTDGNIIGTMSRNNKCLSFDGLTVRLQAGF